ncbi:hypothetical protein WHR41_02172 [Cladosporium halotolerans]|uniref:LysM domain-containing protein n=1 Tax=Cladosporium halotolerans TaxID=1052096 RepID=A0AB34KWV0_9PEZI
MQVLAWLVACASFAQSQQLQGASLSFNYPNISTSCRAALNASVSCHYKLYSLSQRGNFLDEESINAVCVGDCMKSLQQAKSTIENACQQKTDTVTLNGLSYPATFFVDTYLHTYNVSCRKDSFTGDYCDPQLLAWSELRLNTTQRCSDCYLGSLSMRLNSPFGYDDSLADAFTSLEETCNSSTYAWSKPAPYELTPTNTTGPGPIDIPNKNCSGSYEVLESDNCISLSSAMNVSTYNLLYHNNLDIYCQNFASTVGSRLCPPPKCEIHAWRPTDTCASIVSTLDGVSIPRFISWNPNLNSLCQNAVNFIGYNFCIGPPATAPQGPSIDNDSTTSVSSPTPSSVLSRPTNAPDESNKTCGKWYNIVEGDTCSKVTMARGISLSDFLFLNPTVDKDCTNLVLGLAYCVAPIGDIATYVGYPRSRGSARITVPPATFPTLNATVATKTNDPGFLFTAPASSLPRAPGTKQECDTYETFDDARGRDCEQIAFNYQITTEQLLQWNPSLSRNLTDCQADPGFRYCVELIHIDAPQPDTLCDSTDNRNIVPGTDERCICFTAICMLRSDSTDYSCGDLIQDADITLDDLNRWNPWLEGDCESNLYANLPANISRPVCIGTEDTISQSMALALASSPPISSRLTSASANATPSLSRTMLSTSFTVPGR